MFLLLDLKALLMEAKQRIPPFLENLEVEGATDIASTLLTVIMEANGLNEYSRSNWCYGMCILWWVGA